MGGAWGAGPMMAIGPLIMFLLVFGLVILVTLKVLRADGGSLDDLGSMFYSPSRSGDTEALALPRERFAKGEIDGKEFEERKRLLSD